MTPSNSSRLAPVLFAILALPTAALAQRQFAEDAWTSMPPLREASYAVAAADVDGDSDLDLVVGSHALGWGWQNNLFLGDGTGQFTDVTATHLPAARHRTASVALGDVDGDGDPDLVTANDLQNRLYLNDGNGVFTDETFGRLPFDAMPCRKVLLLDLDGDADLDLIFAAYRQELLYLNDGNGVFTDVTATHLPINATSSWDMAAADVDADGDIDLLLAEQNGHALWLNDGNAVFTAAAPAQMPPVGLFCQAVAFADVDGDTDPDLVSGYWQASPTVHLNDGSGTFADATAGNLATSLTSMQDLALEDVDNDGDADLMMAGWLAAFTSGKQLHLNDGTGSFAEVTASHLLTTSTAVTSQILFADVDGDTDPDVVTAEHFTFDSLLLNDGAGVFADAAPRRLHGTMDVPWDIEVADFDGDGDRDLVFANGYYDWESWPNRLHSNDGHGSFLDVTPAAMPLDSDESRSVASGDIDQDGDLDLVFGNYQEQNKLYLNDGSATFTDVTSTHLASLADATQAVALGDVDGDSTLDLVAGNYLEPTALHLNGGAGVMKDVTLANMPAGAHEVRDLALVDVDGDGDLDLVIATGLTQGQRNLLYLNDGMGVFTDVTATNMPNLQRSSACLAVGDVDGDGDADLVFGNDSAGFSTNNSLYLNNGAGIFTSAWLYYGLQDTAAVALADVDDDGDLDFIAGERSHYNELYLNDGTGSFVDATARMPSVLENTRALGLGDIDGDGDVDLIAGNTGSLQWESVVYPNHHRQLAARGLAAIGETLQLDVYSQAGYATGPQSSVVFVAGAEASIPLPPYGTFGLDPSTMGQLPAMALVAPSGRGTASLPIPAVAPFVGLTVYAQALVLPTANPADARLTNTVAARINDF